jgi:hypothetical protein
MSELHGMHFLFIRLAVEEGSQFRQAVGIKISGDVDVLQAGSELTTDLLVHSSF